jgi:antitoxin ParD1/3/4
LLAIFVILVILGGGGLSDMATMNISLPDTMRGFIENCVTESGYGTVSEYVRELIREDQKRRAQEKLEAQLLAALNSGAPIKVTPEYVRQTLAELVEKHGVKESA